ncbi:PadR family transcriptional regulator [Nocardiopsis trehalosi]|uniref:PadR family transcriptional regulator n=1 Tax=Nocardiopsis trehalosi TaxID=109329 RepID=UPI000830B3B7|nr:helix-turn-helix transcriptional regulator [Nocardiopsis trehalosi]
MTATRLLVLGTVRMFGQAHGYQVRRSLVVWGAEDWANVKPGSIYHALRQLVKVGMLRTAGTEESAEGPERTLFELTEDGTTEFVRLLSRALSDAGAKPELFGAGITFMTSLPRRTVVTLLRHRLAELEGGQSVIDSLREDGAADAKPAHVRELFEWWSVQGAAAVAFTRGMIERLEDGAYEMAGEVPAPFGLPAPHPDPR